MVAPQERLASAFAVVCGRYGDVSRQAHQRRICRQSIYRESAWVLSSLDSKRWRQQIADLKGQLRQSQQRITALEARLAQAVVLDRDKQAEFACEGHARGVSLPDLHALLDVLRPGQVASVATLGRWTKAAGQQAGAVLAVFDDYACALVRQGCGDEIYVTDPVLMVVEPESLCWVSGRLTETLSGEAWAEQLRRLPALEQLTRDAGSALARGMALLIQERQQQGQAAPADQLDHFHVLRGGSQGVRHQQGRLRSALAAAEECQAAWQRQRRRGQSQNGYAHKARDRWAKAERAMDTWRQHEALWQKTKAALQLITPDGQLNTRERAEAVLAETLPQLPDADFAKPKRMLHQRQTLTYLDEVQRKLAALPVPADIRRAAVRQECLRRARNCVRATAPKRRPCAGC